MGYFQSRHFLFERIKQEREKLGMSQEALAKKLGYKSRSTIAKIEAGENDITQSKIVAFAEALETTTSYLMGWDEIEQEEYEIQTIAAHHDRDEWSKEELKEIEWFKELVKAKRQKK